MSDLIIIFYNSHSLRVIRPQSFFDLKSQLKNLLLLNSSQFEKIKVSYLDTAGEKYVNSEEDYEGSKQYEVFKVTVEEEVKKPNEEGINPPPPIENSKFDVQKFLSQLKEEQRLFSASLIESFKKQTAEFLGQKLRELEKKMKEKWRKMREK